MSIYYRRAAFWLVLSVAASCVLLVALYPDLTGCMLFLPLAGQIKYARM